MRGWALALVAIGSALLAGFGFVAGSVVLGALGAALLVGWFGVVWFAVSDLGALLLAVTVGAAAAAVLADVAVLPVIAGVTLVVIGWELANALATTAAYPASDRRPVLRRHLLRLIEVGAAAFVLSVVSLGLHVRVGFRLGLSLALASLLLLGLAFRLAGFRRRGKEKAEQ